MRKYVGFISENYSFDILRPIQNAALAQGSEFIWFLDGNNVNTELFLDNERYETDIKQLINYAADAIFTPGNVVPSFVPGLKVQVFHGFEWKKKGHWRIRNCFDLYCTQGPFFTAKFNELQAKHQHFLVQETGWPKLDNAIAPITQERKFSPTVLYAPTFSPAYCSTPELFEEIIKLSHSEDWQWLVKFHPKMDSTWIDKFRAQSHHKLKLVGDAHLASAFATADVLLSDTSSIITEFLLQGKPAVTYKNASPDPVFIDFVEAPQLKSSIETALHDVSRKERIEQFCHSMHPYRDQLSSERILSCVENILTNNITAERRKPLNIIRHLKARKAYKYWAFR